jgi:hypothetical protein
MSQNAAPLSLSSALLSDPLSSVTGQVFQRRGSLTFKMRRLDRFLRPLPTEGALQGPLVPEDHTLAQEFEVAADDVTPPITEIIAQTPKYQPFCPEWRRGNRMLLDLLAFVNELEESEWEFDRHVHYFDPPNAHGFSAQFCLWRSPKPRTRYSAVLIHMRPEGRRTQLSAVGNWLYDCWIGTLESIMTKTDARERPLPKAKTVIARTHRLRRTVGHAGTKTLLSGEFVALHDPQDFSKLLRIRVRHLLALNFSSPFKHAYL